MLGYTARQRPNSEGQQADEMNFSIPRPRKGQIFSESSDLLLFLSSNRCARMALAANRRLRVPVDAAFLPSGGRASRNPQPDVRELKAVAGKFAALFV